MHPIFINNPLHFLHVNNQSTQFSTCFLSTVLIGSESRLCVFPVQVCLLPYISSTIVKLEHGKCTGLAGIRTHVDDLPTWFGANIVLAFDVLVVAVILALGVVFDRVVLVVWPSTNTREKTQSQRSQIPIRAQQKVIFTQLQLVMRSFHEYS